MRIGQIMSEEIKEKIRQSHVGVSLTKDHKTNISEAHKRRGTIPPSREGATLTNAQKNKISIALKGKLHHSPSEETRKLLSIKISGVKHPAGCDREMTQPSLLEINNAA